MGRLTIIGLTRSLVVGGLIIFASGVWAQTTWQPPKWEPPSKLSGQCPETFGACVDAPLNAGANAQLRSGPLGVQGNVTVLGTTLTGGLLVTASTTAAVELGVPVDLSGLLRLRCPVEDCTGYVLTSDATGVATWQPASTATTTAASLAVNLNVRIAGGVWNDSLLTVPTGTTAVELSWQTVGVSGQNCVAMGNWLGPRASTGTETITLTGGNSSYSFGLICWSAAGTVADAVVVVSDADTLGIPTVDLKAKKDGEPDSAYRDGPFILKSGDKLQVKWESSNVTGCTQIGSVNGWNGPVSTSGGPVTLIMSQYDNALGINCTGPDGDVSDAISIIVGGISAPDLQMFVNGIGNYFTVYVPENAPFTVSWVASPDVDSCEVPTESGFAGWEGTKPAPSGQITFPAAPTEDSLNSLNFALRCWRGGLAQTNLITVMGIRSSSFVDADIKIKPDVIGAPFSDGPLEVEPGDTVFVDWESNAPNCSNHDNGDGIWNGPDTPNGATSFVAPNNPGVYDLHFECSKDGNVQTDWVRLIIRDSLNLDVEVKKLFGGSYTDGPLTIAPGEWITFRANFTGLVPPTDYGDGVDRFCTAQSFLAGYMPQLNSGIIANTIDPNSEHNFRGGTVPGTYVYTWQCYFASEYYGLHSASDVVIVEVDGQLTQEKGLLSNIAGVIKSGLNNFWQKFFSIPQAEAAWSEPGEAPPACSDPNAPGCTGPLNESNEAQAKLGTVQLTGNRGSLGVIGLLRAVKLWVVDPLVNPSSPPSLPVLTPETDVDVGGTLRLRGGEPAPGKVLMADALGIGSWAALSGSGGVLPYVDLKINGSDGPVVINGGLVSAVSATWTGTVGATCVASGAWSGTKNGSGSLSVPLPSRGPGRLVYSLTCTAGGLRYADTVVVLVQGTAPTPNGDFNFSLSNGGNKTGKAGETVSNTISLTLLSDETRPVDLTVLGLPIDASAQFTSSSCAPSCTTTLQISLGTRTPRGTFKIIVIGVGGGVTKSTSFDLIVGTVSGTNLAPIVNAGPDQSLSSPSNNVSLNGSATDDGLPNPPGALSYTWSKVSGGGNVTFGQSSSPTTIATFSAPGTYVLRLTASDSILSGSDTMTVNYQAAGSFDFSITDSGDISVPRGGSGQNVIYLLAKTGTPAPVALSVSGLPGGATASWSQSSCTPTCSSNLTIQTTAATPLGTYPISVRGQAGSLSRTVSFNLTVNEVNTAPVISFTAESPITLPDNTSLLAATVYDDGLPNPPGALTHTWSKVSGPGTVSFSSQNTLTTTATFSAPGSYVLKLTTTDGALTATYAASVGVIDESAPANILELFVNGQETINARINEAVVLSWVVHDTSFGPCRLYHAGQSYQTGEPVGRNGTRTIYPGNVVQIPNTPTLTYYLTCMNGEYWSVTDEVIIRLIWN